MKVLKFGGTSVGSIDSLRNVKAIVESQQTECIVTVSALGGITDCLMDCARRASVGDNTYIELHQAMKERHHSVIDGVVTDAARHAEVMEKVDTLLQQLSTLFDAIALLGELTSRTMDLIVSYGERMSCVIVSNMLSDAALCYSPDFIRTRSRFGKHVLAQESTSRLIAEIVAPELKRHRTIVVPGFIARDDDSGKITNLGRGGSDYTAAIIAAELGAEILEIWTDVDGFMTADPRIVKNAEVIDRMSFVEAMELCNFGAKVVYSPTIYPVFNRNIPIVIKNTFNAQAPGTIIADGEVLATRMAGLSSMTPTAIIRISGSRPVNFDRVFNSLSRNGVDIFLASPENGTFGLRGSDVESAMAILSDELADELTTGEIENIQPVTGLSTIALVGYALDGMTDIDKKLVNVLNGCGIPVPAPPRMNASTTVSCMF
ncbi:MAG: aspartate kinase, partial [Muribaculaceae bacterium]|nr:aspartate kinase [Muribaculaceae bacterium]